MKEIKSNLKELRLNSDRDFNKFKRAKNESWRK